MKNIELINASAGSGKTYNLTSRIIEVLENGVNPEELMVTTFTKRAAAELRERIRIKLIKDKKTDEAIRINDSLIGTVNSICDKLLKEYAIDAGLSPATEVMPEEESAYIFKISIDNVIDKYSIQMEDAAKRMELDGSGNGYQQNSDWRNDVKRIVELARSNQITSTKLMECYHSSWKEIKNILGDPIKTDIDKELDDAITLAIDNLSNIGKLTVKTNKALDTLKECKRHILNNNIKWSDWTKLSKLEPANDGKDMVKDVIFIANNVLRHPQFQADVKQIIEGAFKCAIESLQNYDEYKKNHGLLDFIDQESTILTMLKTNNSFRNSISNRIQILMVDEFQDTSPIQLALFLSINEIVSKSIWVGDPKQAIYGFRGTDPQLMEEAVKRLGESQVLDCSWRSKENLINFTNNLYSEVFNYMGKEKVCLKIPKEREAEAKGGDLEVWHLIANKETEELQAIANGVRNLMERNKDIKPGDIAILCRKNENCIKIALHLEKLGIRASVGQGSLMETKECKLALAALRYMNNPNDTVALSEIFILINESDECLKDLISYPHDTLDKWQNDSLITDLNEGRNNIKYWTPLEALEQAINRIDLIYKVKYWSNSSLAISNLDYLRGACNEYINKCNFKGSAPTVAGFINYMQNSEKKQAQGLGDQTVNVLTYHASKGLEWPWVILTGLDSAPRVNVFGVNIEASPKFDSANPLANRSIRYWPWPFGPQKTFEPLNDIIDSLPVKEYETKMVEHEEQRLMYVGMTRARDGLVISVRKSSTKSSISLKTNWLDIMKTETGKKIINMNTDTDVHEIQVGDTLLPVAIFEYDSYDSVMSALIMEEEEYLPTFHCKAEIYPPARVSPSLLPITEETDGKSWEIIERLNSFMIIKGNPEMDVLGNAIHTYFATDYVSLTSDEQITAAEKILKNWGVNDVVEVSELCSAGNNLIEFLDNRYKVYNIYKEWPMFMRNEKGQFIQGWIDMLLETQEGYVIIDHKDYPGKNSEKRAKLYTPQMLAYKEAIEKSTSKPVIDILLHLPFRGLILQLK